METLGNVGFAAEFAKDQYRHCKPILAVGEGRTLVENAGIPLVLPSGAPDPGLIAVSADELDEAIGNFVTAIEKHRHFERETDPQRTQHLDPRFQYMEVV
jgi:catalase